MNHTWKTFNLDIYTYIYTRIYILLLFFFKETTHQTPLHFTGLESLRKKILNRTSC